MDAMNMQKTNILNNLKEIFPNIKQSRGKYYKWNPVDETVYYPNDEEINFNYLLHEYGHALLHHNDYELAIDLVAMEQEAWLKTIEIADKLNFKIDENLANEAINSYRIWMQKRSTCPNCSNAGIETKKNNYKCLICSCSWKVNDAKKHNLKRFKND